MSSSFYYKWDAGFVNHKNANPFIFTNRDILKNLSYSACLSCTRSGAMP